MRVTVRAPGKAFLCGEYAVLTGAPAVVMAVDRHARATFDPELEDTPRVDTSGLHRNGRKLGLGSSAASTVAAEAARRAAGGAALTDARVRDDLFRYCHLAHSGQQGGRGSGADVAASVFGGIVEVTRVERRQAPVVAPSSLPGIEARLYWTGQPASTPELVERVLLGGVGDGIWGPLKDEAWRFADACQRHTGDDALGAARRYAELLVQLGEACGVPIVTGPARELAEAAEAMGGAAKPSGAGGGDLVVAFLPGGARFDALDAAALAAGLEPLADVRVDRAGVATESGIKEQD